MKSIKRKSVKWWLGISACFLLFLIIALFSYTKMNFLVRGVQIDAWIEYGNNSSIAKVGGQAERAVLLSLNGREIFIDKDGFFVESISLLPGFDVITLNAKDKFGKTAEKKIEVYYENG